MPPSQQRTLKQNASLHKFLELLCEELNDAGLTVQATLKPGIEVNWTPALAKELLWRPVQKKVLGKKSTTQLRKQQDIDLVHDTINRHLAERFPGLPHVPWPSLENLIQEQNYET